MSSLSILLLLLASWFSLIPSAPILAAVETYTKKYYYSSYPPDNPYIKITRTLTLTEPNSRKIKEASVIMYNTTAQDYLYVSETLLTSKSLTSSFFPQTGRCLLLISGNGTAADYQTILRAAQYQAPLRYSKTATTTHFWRNVTFQVVNVLDESSNVVERPLTIDAAHKVLQDDFSGYLNDIGLGSRFNA